MNRRSLICAVFLSIFCIATAHAQPLPQIKPSTTQLTIISTPLTRVSKGTMGKPLNNRDIALYKEIYRLQALQDWETANDIIPKIDNSILIGHVTAQRYLHPEYKPTQSELQRWMSLYSDHPESTIIAKMLNQVGSRYKKRVTGTIEELRYFSRGSKYFSTKYNSGERYEINLVRREVNRYLDRGAATAALNYFENHRINRYIDPIDKSQMLAQIASVYLYLGHSSKARKTAVKAVKLSTQTPIAPWIMGLTAWMNNDFKDAAKNFTLAAHARYASPWMTSAAAYWGARASTRAGLYKDVSGLLAMAVKNQRTFYGLIATKALGYGFDFNWTMPNMNAKMQNVLQQNPASARAVALAQIGQLRLAEAELHSLNVRKDSQLAEAAIALAHQYNLAGFAMRFSSAMPNPAGGYYDAGLFPVSSWTKHRDDNADVALLNAFIRQESRFDIGARNATGATGLMQIMPDTAAFIADDPIYKSDAGRALLSNPKTNIEIGQNYLNHLLDLDVVDNDLFGLAIAYNAGPGKLGRWKRELKVKDPLLFIELIPASETRAFVERVATNYWIYQMQMGHTPSTLNAVASGLWPKLR
jgi:soluble lytic murein transglycosylase